MYQGRKSVATGNYISLQLDSFGKISVVGVGFLLVGNKAVCMGDPLPEAHHGHPRGRVASLKEVCLPQCGFLLYLVLCSISGEWYKHTYSQSKLNYFFCLLRKIKT